MSERAPTILHADAWMGGAVTLDGEDVTDRTKEVHLEGERAIAVRLLVLSPTGAMQLDAAKEGLLTEIRTGTITFRLRPRPKWRNAAADER